MYEQIAANKRRSAALLLGFVLLLVLVGIAVGWAIGNGPLFTVGALVVAAALAAGSYWKSDAVALRMSRAQPADPEQYRRLYNLVEGLCIASGLPIPRLFIIDDPAPNAFATGRDPKHAAVAVTTGLLDKMNRVELEAVLAHELSHVKNYDILVATIAVTLVGAIALISDTAIRWMWWNGGRVRRDGDRNDSNNPLAFIGFALLILAPLVATVMQFAVGRRRELLADVSAVQLTRYPPGLISALEKLRDDSTVVHASSRATAHLWIEAPTAQVPEEGRLSAFNRLFETHPPLEDRIAILREL